MFGNLRSAEFRHRRIQAYSGSLVRSIKIGPMRNSRIKWRFLRTLQLPQKNPNLSKKSRPPNLLAQILYIFFVSFLIHLRIRNFFPSSPKFCYRRCIPAPSDVTILGRPLLLLTCSHTHTFRIYIEEKTDMPGSAIWPRKRKNGRKCI